MKQCGAYSVSGGTQCQRKVLPGSRYCFLHQSWGFNVLASVVTLLLGAVLGVLASDVYHHFVPSVESRKLADLKSTYLLSQRKPSFKFYMNGREVFNGSAYVLPTTAATHRLSFTLSNSGNLPAQNAEIGVIFPRGVTNIAPTGGWTARARIGYQDGRIVQGSDGAIGLRCSAQTAIAQGDSFGFEDLFLNYALHDAPSVLPMHVDACATGADHQRIRFLLVLYRGMGDPVVTKSE